MNAPVFDLTNEKTGSLLYGINLDVNREIRPGYIQKWTPTGISAKECVAVEQLQYAASWPGANSTSKIIAVWSDGSVTMDSAASVATATSTNPRWAKLVPITVPAWSSGTSSWEAKNVMILYTDTKTYIFDPTTPVAATYLYELQTTTPTAPSAGAPAGGSIPAGTYKFVATEITCHGIETIKSTAVTVTSVTDFQVVFTPAAAANTSAVRWRLYMSKESDFLDNTTYSLVDEAAIAGTITANLKPTALGLTYDNARISLPATTSTGCIHQGVLASAGDSADCSNVFISATSVDETGYGLTGYPEVGHVVATYPTSKQLKTVALASLTGSLLVFTNNGITAIYGDAISGADVQVKELSSSVGTLNDRTVAVLGDKVFFMDYNGGRAYVTDGYRVQDITEGSHLLEGIWYALTGNQYMNYRGQLQGQFTANIVMADPIHNKVWFGGEIVSDTYASSVAAGTWSAAAKTGNPQGNRQFVWRVFDVQESKWLTWTNIPVRSYCLKDGVVYFGDHVGHIWTLNNRDAKDGATGTSLVTGAITNVSSSTTITLTSAWTGTATIDAPLMIFNVSSGVTQLRYVVSATSAGFTVDKAVTITSTDVLFYGVPVAEVWTMPLVEPAKIHSIEWLILSDSQDSWATAIAMIKTRAAHSGWVTVAEWLPQSAGRSRAILDLFCPSMMFRMLLPSGNYAASNIEAITNFTISNIRVNGTPMPKARW